MSVVRTHGDHQTRPQPSAAGMRLRVHGPGQHGREVAIHGAKCTVGASPACGLQVEGPGIPPFCGLLVRGPGGAVFRSLDSSLMDVGFEDRILAHGDRMAIGPCEIELLAPPSRHEERDVPDPQYFSRLQQLEHRFAELEEEYAETRQSQLAAIRTARHSNETIDQLLTQLSGERARHALNSEQWLAERRQLETSVGELRDELDGVRCELEQRQPDEHELEKTRAQLAAQTRRIEELTQSTHEQLASFAVERENFEQERLGLQERLEDVSNRAAELQQKLERELASFDSDRQQWAAQQSDLEAKLANALEVNGQLEQTLAANDATDQDAERERDEAASRLSQTVAALDDLTGELENQRLQHEQEQREWTTVRDELQGQVALLQRELDDARAAARQPEMTAADDTRAEKNPATGQTVDYGTVDNSLQTSALGAFTPESSATYHGELPEPASGVADDSPAVQPGATDWTQGYAAGGFSPPMGVPAGSPLDDDNDTGGQAAPIDELPLGAVTTRPVWDDVADTTTPDSSLDPTSLAADVAEDPSGIDGTPSYVDSPYVDSQNADRHYSGLADTTAESAASEPVMPPFEHDLAVGADTQEPERELSSNGAPVSAMDVLSQLGSVWSDDEDNDVSQAASSGVPVDAFRLSEPAATPAMPEPAQSSVGTMPGDAPSGDASAGEDDESVEEYMNRLLQRVNGGSSPSPAPSAPEATYSPVSVAPTTGQDEVESATPEPAAAPAEPLAPEEYRPRSQAPEDGVNLDAMRSLANDSARTAIASHAKQTWTSWLQVKLIASFIAAAAVAYGVMFNHQDAGYLVLAAIFGGLMAMYWGTQLHAYRQLSLAAFKPLGESPPAQRLAETSCDERR